MSRVGGILFFHGEMNIIFSLIGFFGRKKQILPIDFVFFALGLMTRHPHIFTRIASRLLPRHLLLTK